MLAALPAPFRADGSPWTDRQHADDPAAWFGAEAAGADAYAIDRQRVLTSNAFRRLQYKTQVFVTRSGDHFRTRLTHTLEVAALARWMATRLGLNHALAETVALAHDLGHPPYGHAGERVLDAFARDRGLSGFEHNRQSLRVVEYLEHPYPPFRGLNLTRAIRDSLAFHETPFDTPDRAASSGQLTLEGQLVNVADQIAYLVHDLEDAWLLDIVTAVPKFGPLKTWREFLPRGLKVGSAAQVRRPVCEAWQHQLLDDAIAATLQAVAAAQRDGVDGVEAVTQMNRPLVGFSDAMQAGVDEWRAFNIEHIYRHPSVVRREKRCELILRHVLDGLVDDPALLPERWRKRLEDAELAVVVIDYVAGSTERFVEGLFERL